MKRRNFLQVAAGGGAAAALAAPAIAQSQPKLSWRLTSGFPASLDTLYGTAVTFANHVSEMTDGNFEIEIFASGQIVATPQAAEAVETGTVEMAHTPVYYYLGRDPAFALGTAIPYGLNARQMNAWLYQGGGSEMLNAFFAKYKLYGLPGGNTGVQMGGWWRNEIGSVADLKGVKMRIAGLGGMVMEKLGVVPQQIPGSDVYPALERGTIDAAEWVGPYDDEKLGLYRIAPYYYYPAFWEGGPTVHFLVNLDRWNALPAAYKAAITNAAAYANIDMLAKYDARNPVALQDADRRRRQAQAVPAGRAGGGLRRGQRDLCRPLGQERRLQDALRQHAGVPQRGLPLVPGRGVQLRQLHDPQPQQGLIRPPVELFG